MLQEIGYADALLTRELPDGRLTAIDGHLRAEITPDTIVPVLVTDLSEAEAKKLLATVDPLAGMAETDGNALSALLAEIETTSPTVQALLDEQRRLLNVSVGVRRVSPPTTLGRVRLWRIKLRMTMRGRKAAGGMRPPRPQSRGKLVPVA
jgi:hypothetical protein